MCLMEWWCLEMKRRELRWLVNGFGSDKLKKALTKVGAFILIYDYFYYMNLTYVLGAGASANALPLIRDMDKRIDVFVEHLISEDGLDVNQINELKKMVEEIKRHYTIDTYAKKIFLKNKGNDLELLRLKNFMGSYFIYEQLRKDKSDQIGKYLYDKASNNYDRKDIFSVYNSIIEPVDYRYDSFFAAVLKNDLNKGVYLPNNINFISWNYDSQLEISLMNFIDGSGMDEIQKKLNVFPNPRMSQLNENSSAVVKLNGTAGFYSDKKKYGDLFDFREHQLDRDSFDILRNINFEGRLKYKNSIYFAWNNDDDVSKARQYARDIISHTDILVVIGYSFPYFNRDVDRYIFKALEEKGRIIYIQATESTFESIKNRAIGASLVFRAAKPFIELDQFLIPNDFV